MNQRERRTFLIRELLRENAQYKYLQAETAVKGITDLDDLNPVEDGIYLWQGDITTLHCDAIVNAANSGMTGCYVPNHRCIDNCIHSFSGIQLRIDCAEMMRLQVIFSYTMPFSKEYRKNSRLILSSSSGIR